MNCPKFRLVYQQRLGTVWCLSYKQIMKHKAQNVSVYWRRLHTQKSQHKGQRIVRSAEGYKFWKKQWNIFFADISETLSNKAYCLWSRTNRTKYIHIATRSHIMERMWQYTLLADFTSRMGPAVGRVSVVGIANGARFSAPVQTGPGAHPTSCTMGTGSFLGVKSGRGVTLTPHPLLVPWS